MAKVRRKTTSVKVMEKVITKNTEGGVPARVQVSLGITTSYNYQSTKFDVGLSQDVKPGESTVDGLARTLVDVNRFWGRTVMPVLDGLVGNVTDRAERRKNLSS